MTLGPEQAEDRFISAIESVLLVAGGPVSMADLAAAVEGTRAQVQRAVRALSASLTRGIRLQFDDGHAQLVTAPDNAAAVQRFLGTAQPPPLSHSALEALTVIAYRQPVTRSEIEAARGVNSDRAVHTLIARGLIEERGRRQSLGRPMEYGTTFAFLEYFGLGSLEDLPPLPTTDTPRADASVLGLRRSAEQPQAQEST